MENGLATEVETEQKEENTPQTPQQTSPPSLACRSLEKCNSCTNSISPMNEPATLERVLNQQSHRKVEKETREQITERNERRKEKDRKWSREKKEKRKKRLEKQSKRRCGECCAWFAAPRKEDFARLPKCRGFLNDDADIQRRRPRPPPQGVVDRAAVDSSSAANKN